MSVRTIPGVLGEIVRHTRERVEAGKRTTSIEWLLTRTGPTRRAFSGALSGPSLNVIAEHKRRSPSRGSIREDLAPADVAEKDGVSSVPITGWGSCRGPSGWRNWQNLSR